MRFKIQLFERKNLIVLLFTVGVFFLIYALLPDQQNILLQKEKLGRVTPLTGQTDLLTDNLSKRQKLTEASAVKNSDSIQTDEIGKALLNLESGHDIEIQPSTLITLEKNIEGKSQYIVMILKNGQVRVAKDGKPNSLYIAKNGIRVPSVDYENSQLANEAFKEAPTSEIENLPATTLTEQEVTATLSQSRSLFFKCYTKLLQKNQSQIGDVSLSFSIENSGSVKDIDVITDLGDQEFKNCLQQVVERVRFRPFKGSPISAFFPIKFEN